MKKILFVVPGLSHGGTNRTLLNLLGFLDPEKYQVSVLAMRYTGPYREKFGGYLLPEENLLSIFYSMSPAEALSGDSLSRRLGKVRDKLFMKLVLKDDREKIFDRAAQKLSRENWDVVVAFQESLATELAGKIRAPRHLAWVHCDYARRQQKDPLRETAVYQQYDRIVAVSRYTAETFRRELPAVGDRVTALHNLMDDRSILAQSREPLQDPAFVPAPFTLVSVGRLDPVKRFSSIPAMARQLRDREIPFRWYLIGDGGTEKETLKAEISRCHLEDRVILLGSRDNPYPYMQAASVVVCPSLSEACPNVVSEAMILRVPVAAADFPTAGELITDGETGIIAPLEELGNRLVQLALNPDCLRTLQRGLSGFAYDNGSLYTEIENLIDGEDS